MDYNLFDFVKYNDNICILVDYDDTIATILFIFYYGDDSMFCVFEYDVKLKNIRKCDEEAPPIMERLRSYRMSHDDAFGFVDEELSLIHYF